MSKPKKEKPPKTKDEPQSICDNCGMVYDQNDLETCVGCGMVLCHPGLCWNEHQDMCTA